MGQTWSLIIFMRSKAGSSWRARSAMNTLYLPTKAKPESQLATIWTLLKRWSGRYNLVPLRKRPLPASGRSPWAIQRRPSWRSCWWRSWRCLAEREWEAWRMSCHTSWPRAISTEGRSGGRTDGLRGGWTSGRCSGTAPRRSAARSRRTYPESGLCSSGRCKE